MSHCRPPTTSTATIAAYTATSTRRDTSSQLTPSRGSSSPARAARSPARRLPSRQPLPRDPREDAPMSYEKDPRVDAYIDALPQWQRSVCREVRELVHAADPEVVETIKRRGGALFLPVGDK